MTKNTDERAMRLAKRNALIFAIFYELTTREGYSFMQAYLFLEGIFGLNDCQIRRILRQKSKSGIQFRRLVKICSNFAPYFEKRKGIKAYGISRSLSFRKKAKKEKRSKKEK